MLTEERNALLWKFSAIATGIVVISLFIQYGIYPWISRKAALFKTNNSGNLTGRELVEKLLEYYGKPCKVEIIPSALSKQIPSPRSGYVQEANTLLLREVEAGSTTLEDAFHCISLAVSSVRIMEGDEWHQMERAYLYYFIALSLLFCVPGFLFLGLGTGDPLFIVIGLVFSLSTLLMTAGNFVLNKKRHYPLAEKFVTHALPADTEMWKHYVVFEHQLSYGMMALMALASAVLLYRLLQP